MELGITKRENERRKKRKKKTREKRGRFFRGRKILEVVSESGRLWCYGFVFICVYARTLTFRGVARATTIGGSMIVLNCVVALH